MEAHISEIAKYIWPILAVPMGWCMKQISDLKKEYYETKVHSAETYISKSDYREDLKTLHMKIDAYAAKNDAQFSKILERIESKADKK